MSTKKLSAYCIACGEPHSEAHMRSYVDRCVRRGRDPLAAPRGGICCARCVLTMLLELDEDGLEETQP